MMQQHILKSHLAASLGQAGSSSSSSSPYKTQPNFNNKLEPGDSKEPDPDTKQEDKDGEADNSSDQDDNAEHNPNVKLEADNMEGENCLDQDEDNKA